MLLTPHPLYTALATTEMERQSAYQKLFRHQVVHRQLHEIRDALRVIGDRPR